MQEELISVIVPVYNVEKYLHKCVDSILNQTYKNLEIILVDDGSPDDCGAICDEYAKKDSRVRVIHKQNGGLSDARNAGIEAASGRYIGFVDSDDYINQSMYETLYRRIIEDESDLAVCNFVYIDEKGNEITERNINSPVKNGILTGEQILSEKLVGEKQWYWVIACSKLYKRELFREIRFPKGKIHEDEFTAHIIYNKCKLVSAVEKPMYYYVQRSLSIMNVSADVKRLDGAEAFFDRARFYIEKKQYDNAVFAVRQAFGLIKAVCSSDIKNDKSVRERVKELKKIYNKIYFRLIGKKVSFKNKVLLCVFLVDKKNTCIMNIYIKQKKAITYLYLLKHSALLLYKLITLKKKNKGKVFCLMLTPEHDNIGDAMIAMAERKYLNDYFPEYGICEFPGELLSRLPKWIRKIIYRAIKKEKILIHGGGFLGTLWYEAGEVPLRDILNAVCNSDVTILPQTMYYENSEWGRAELEKSKTIYNKNSKLRICLRENISYETAKKSYCNTYLIPDMVMYLNYSNEKFVRQGIKLCLRSDVEKTLSDEEKTKILDFAKRTFGEDVTYVDMIAAKSIKPGAREEVTGEQLMKFKTAELVITDRLHGMIFAAITGTPCIVVNSKSHKVKGCYEWISNLPYIRFADDVMQIDKIYEAMLGLGESAYNNEHLLKYYDKLAEIIRRG